MPLAVHIAQIVLPGASEYERKCQRVDHEGLTGSHTVTLTAIDDARGDVAHVYGPAELPAEIKRLKLPYVSNGTVRRGRWPWSRTNEPGAVVSPLADRPLPEAVEIVYFGAQQRPGSNVIGSFHRPAIVNMVEQTMTRIHRFRDDVRWNLFERVPTPEDLAGVDLWVDPAIDENDFDGFVAEAIVAGLPVVAARSPMNALRLEKGRTGFLVPRNDPNEATHAILSALFKPEVAQQKVQAARQTASKFQARQRVRLLAAMYESLIR